MLSEYPAVDSFVHLYGAAVVYHVEEFWNRFWGILFYTSKLARKEIIHHR